jgi:hypothetical protein
MAQYQRGTGWCVSDSNPLAVYLKHDPPPPFIQYVVATTPRYLLVSSKSSAVYTVKGPITTRKPATRVGSFSTV